MMTGKKWYAVKREGSAGLLYVFSADNFEAVKEKTDVLFGPVDIRPLDNKELNMLLGMPNCLPKHPDHIANGNILIAGSGVTDICLWPL